MLMLELSRRGAFRVGGATFAAAAAPSVLFGAPSRLAPPPITPAERAARIARAQSRMQALGIGALLVEPGASLDYFTGVQWWRSERLTAAVIPATGQPIVITPFFERPSVAESLKVPAEIRVWQEHESPFRLVADLLRERGAAAAPVALEETVRYFAADGLQRQLPGVRLVSGNPVVRPLRMIKSPAEIALMQHATDLTIQALRTTHGEVRGGMSNGEIGAVFERHAAALGGESPWSLVLVDEAAALPHGTGRPQQVKRGSLVLMDCGCGFGGYQADVSRTFIWGGAPTAEQRRVWEQVRRGQEIARSAARVGVAAGSVDDAVRRAYEGWGYGPGYALPGLSHRTGHGIGMEGHEPVNLVHGETIPLAPGMCFSNEPGIYLPGKFGVRLEDCFHMTEAGPKWFSEPPTSIDRPFD